MAISAAKLTEHSILTNTTQTAQFDPRGVPIDFTRQIGKDTYRFTLEEGKITDKSSVYKNGQLVTGPSATNLRQEGHKYLEALEQTASVKSYARELEQTLLNASLSKELQDQAKDDLKRLRDHTQDSAEKAKLQKVLEKVELNDHLSRFVKSTQSHAAVEKQLAAYTKQAGSGVYAGFEGLARIANGEIGDVTQRRAAQEKLKKLADQPGNADKVVQALLDSYKPPSGNKSTTLETVGQILAKGQLSAETDKRAREAIRRGLNSNSPLEQRSAFRGIQALAERGDLTSDDAMAISAAVRSNITSELTQGIQNLPNITIGVSSDAKLIEGKRFKEELLGAAEAELKRGVTGIKRENAIEAVVSIGSPSKLTDSFGKPLYGLKNVKIFDAAHGGGAEIIDKDKSRLFFSDAATKPKLENVTRADGSGWERHGTKGYITEHDKNWKNWLRRDQDYIPFAGSSSQGGYAAQDLIAKSRFPTVKETTLGSEQVRDALEAINALEKLAKGPPPNAQAAEVLKALPDAHSFEKTLGCAASPEAQDEALSKWNKHAAKILSVRAEKHGVEHVVRDINENASPEQLIIANQEIAAQLLTGKGGALAQKWYNWTAANAQLNMLKQQVKEEPAKLDPSLKVAKDEVGRPHEFQKGELHVSLEYHKGNNSNKPDAVRVGHPFSKHEVIIPDGPVKVDQNTGVISFSKRTADPTNLSRTDTSIGADGKIANKVYDEFGLRRSKSEHFGGTKDPAVVTSYSYIGADGKATNNPLAVKMVMAETSIGGKVISRQTFDSFAAVELDRPGLQETITTAKGTDGVIVEKHSFQDVSNPKAPKPLGEASKTINPNNSEAHFVIKSEVLQNGTTEVRKAVFTQGGQAKSFGRVVGAAELTYHINGNGKVVNVDVTNPKSLGIDTNEPAVKAALIHEGNMLLEQMKQQYRIPDAANPGGTQATEPRWDNGASGELTFKDDLGNPLKYHVERGEILSEDGVSIGKFNGTGDFTIHEQRYNVMNREGTAFQGTGSDGQPVALMANKDQYEALKPTKLKWDSGANGHLIFRNDGGTYSSYRVVKGEIRGENGRRVGEFNGNGEFSIDGQRYNLNEREGSAFHGTGSDGQRSDLVSTNDQKGYFGVLTDRTDHNFAVIGGNIYDSKDNRFVGHMDRNGDLHLDKCNGEAKANIHFTGATFKGIEGEHRRVMHLSDSASAGKLFLPADGGAIVAYEVRMGMIINKLSGEQMGFMTAPRQGADHSLFGGAITLMNGKTVPLANYKNAAFELTCPGEGGLKKSVMKGIALGLPTLANPSQGGLLSISKASESLSTRAGQSKSKLDSYLNNLNIGDKFGGDYQKKVEEMRATHYFDRVSSARFEHAARTILNNYNEQTVAFVRKEAEEASADTAKADLNVLRQQVDSAQLAVEELPRDTSQINGKVTVPIKFSKDGAVTATKEFRIVDGQIIDSEGQKVGKIENEIDESTGEVVEQALLYMNDPRNPDKQLKHMGELTGAVWQLNIPGEDGKQKTVNWVSVGTAKGGVLSASAIRQSIEREKTFAKAANEALGKSKKSEESWPRNFGPLAK